MNKLTLLTIIIINILFISAYDMHKETIRDRYSEWWMRFESGLELNYLESNKITFYQDLADDFLDNDAKLVINGIATTGKSNILDLIYFLANGTNAFDQSELHACLRPYVCKHNLTHYYSICNDVIFTINRFYGVNGTVISTTVLGMKMFLWKLKIIDFQFVWMITHMEFVNSVIQNAPISTFLPYRPTIKINFNNCSIPSID